MSDHSRYPSRSSVYKQPTVTEATGAEDVWGDGYTRRNYQSGVRGNTTNQSRCGNPFCEEHSQLLNKSGNYRHSSKAQKSNKEPDYVEVKSGGFSSGTTTPTTSGSMSEDEDNGHTTEVPKDGASTRPSRGDTKDATPKAAALWTSTPTAEDHETTRQTLEDTRKQLAELQSAHETLQYNFDNASATIGSLIPLYLKRNAEALQAERDARDAHSQMEELRSQLSEAVSRLTAFEDKAKLAQEEEDRVSAEKRDAEKKEFFDRLAKGEKTLGTEADMSEFEKFLTGARHQAQSMMPDQPLDYTTRTCRSCPSYVSGHDDIPTIQSVLNMLGSLGVDVHFD